MKEKILTIHELIRAQFGDQFKIREVRPDIFQLYLPFYHEDGDMVEIYLDFSEKDANGKPAESVRITDFGMTIMRLSYTYELDTPHKEQIFLRILAENCLAEDDGHLFIDSSLSSLMPSLMQFAQAVAKISTMRQFKREVIESLFFEELDDFIMNQLAAYTPQKKVTPIPDRDDLEVDYSLHANGHPVYVFGVKDSNKARLATISCLEFALKKIPFKSYIVHQDFDGLPKKDRIRLLSASDKQFPTLSDFIKNVSNFLEREATLTR